MQNVSPVVGCENRPPGEFEARTTCDNSANQTTCDKIAVGVKWLAVDCRASARQDRQDQRRILLKACVTATAASAPIATWNEFCGLEKSCDKTQINQYRLL